MDSFPTGMVTFLFTDIEGSTKLWEHHPLAMKSALARHDALLRSVITNHDGNIFKTVGDAFCAAFASASNAVLAAIEAQRRLRVEPWEPSIGQIRVRMGLHTGIAEERDGDYFGPPLNRVARLMSAGHGEQILLSMATQALVLDYLPEDITLRNLGKHRLKDLIRPEHIFQVVIPNLQTDFPPLKTLDTFATNLPVELTSFVGREKEIGEIKALLSTSRLVTLVGPGGTGKTRLSKQVAADLLDAFPDGIWFIELAPLTDPSFVAQAVATVLGVREETNQPMLATLMDWMRDKRTLLILDNCEHLVEACARLADALVHACPMVCLLASSRETLNIFGEVVYQVPTLSSPDPRRPLPSETLTQYAAVRLFIDRVQVSLPKFTVTNSNAAALAQICYRLDGIPLAIELAAARVNMLSLDQIVTRLDDRFRLLTSGSRTALPRQQTLRALIDWSYNLLPEAEQILLQRLSVFSGGWILESAEITCAGEPIEHQDIIDLLPQLVNKSLVVVDRVHDDEIRYRFLETIQQYASDKLTKSGDARRLQDRHLDYFMSLAERAEPELTAPDQLAWLDRLEADLDNIHAALNWSLEADISAGLRLASALGAPALGNFWAAQGHLSDGCMWLAQLLARPQEAVPPQIRAKALAIQGRLAQWSGNSKLARQSAEESAALYRSLGDSRGLAYSLGLLGMVAQEQGEAALARAVTLESLALCRTLDDKLGLADVLDALGHGVDNQDYLRARAYLEESLALYRELGHLHGIFHILQALGELAIWQEDYALARPWFEEAMLISSRLGPVNQSMGLGGIGDLAFRQGDYEQARAHYEALLHLTTDNGYRAWTHAHLGHVLFRQGDSVSSRQRFEQALHRFNGSGWKIGVIYTVEGLASLDLAQTHLKRAVLLLGWAEAIRKDIDNRRPPVEQADIDFALSKIRAGMDDDSFHTAWAEGQALTIEQAVALALGQNGNRTR